MKKSILSACLILSAFSAWAAPASVDPIVRVAGIVTLKTTPGFQQLLGSHLYANSHINQTNPFRLETGNNTFAFASPINNQIEDGTVSMFINAALVGNFSCPFKYVVGPETNTDKAATINFSGGGNIPSTLIVLSNGPYSKDIAYVTGTCAVVDSGIKSGTPHLEISLDAKPASK